ncbi:hypothetical protein BN1184_AV_00330 [Pantoea ananatis]|nr:hypothetical protein BN1184_AV_00330 [Pantoea ananatis]
MKFVHRNSVALIAVFRQKAIERFTSGCEFNQRMKHIGQNALQGIQSLAHFPAFR